MDKSTFASYKFKPGDVIEGLNRYFAEAKASRYIRVSLEIKNGEVKPGNYYVIRNIVFDVSAPKVKELGYYYVICDPEAVVGVAINWLREEHDIFYTPGMNEPPIKDPDDIDDFYVDNAAKEYEKATRKDMVPVTKVREALGIAKDSDIFQCIKYRNHHLETLRTELVEARRMYHNAIEERNQFGRRLMDIRKASGMADDDPTDLVEYVKALREKADEQQKKIDSYEATLSKITDIMEPKYEGPAWSETWDDLVERINRMKENVEMLEAAKTDWRDSFEKAQDSRSAFCKKLKEELNVDYRYHGYFPKMEEDILLEIKRLKTEHDDVRGLSLKIEELEEACRRKDHILSEQTKRLNKLVNLRLSILQVYREIFDCSNGDPEGTDEETLQDILTEYKRTLELKNAAEEKTIKYKELARGNEDKANKYKIRLGNAERQLRWTEEVSSERLKQCEDLTREKERTKRLEQKLIEIQDICER